MPFDHELKIKRAYLHLNDLRREERPWVRGKHHRIRQEIDPQTGTLTAFVAADQPPPDPFSVLIADCLCNLRSGLDLLAYSLATAHTRPLPADIAEVSEFPVFGDEDRKGRPNMGANLFRDNGRPKIRGLHPEAQTVIESLQPYHRGDAFRTHPLWLLHDLDRLSKHRLLHVTVAHFAGIGWDIAKSYNVTVGPGAIESFGGPITSDTPACRISSVRPEDPNKKMHLEVVVPVRIAFGEGPAQHVPVIDLLGTVYDFIVGSVLLPLNDFLA